MKRQILLLEPNYQNKYPPIGLMKISTYHKLLGDEVIFYKGNLTNFVIEKFYERSLFKLKRITKKINWKLYSTNIQNYIRTSNREELLNIPLSKIKLKQVEDYLSKFAEVKRRREYDKYPKYDRVYVTTLFTFYWKITIETIKFAKRLVKSQEQLLVGGVMASLLTKEIETATGIKSFTGLLDQPGILDNFQKAKELTVDNLPLDYSILDEIDYKYPTQSAYFTFMTKGCTRKCSFCSVPRLEPIYKPKIETIDKFNIVKDRFGDQRNLLLMDNNVLASPFFPEIVKEIKSMGFIKGATYVEPNQLEIAIQNLRSGYNDKAYLKKSFTLINGIANRIRGDSKGTYIQILRDNGLQVFETFSKQKMLKAYKLISPFFEKYRSKVPKQRYVDFNQGTDARYVTDEIMKLLSEIPIHPLRIAFDYIGLKEIYIRAVELAAKHGISNLSNYILYNFNDTPDDLYERLKINVELGVRLGIKIYSFPMKYIPLFGEEAKGREFIGKNWNKKFIRAIQSMLNVTKGIVAPGQDFFHRAFGKSINEFRELLYMPEEYIVYRKVFEEDFGFTQIWKNQFDNLMARDKSDVVKQLIIQNDFSDINKLTKDPVIMELLKHYTLKKHNKHFTDPELIETQRTFEKLIKRDRFIELTLTYDFE